MDTAKNTLQTYFAAGFTKTYDKDVILIQANENPDGVYQLVSGFVKVYAMNGRGDKYTHVVYGPGEIFPLMWLTAGQLRNVYYETMTQCELKILSREQVLADIDKDVELARAFFYQAVQQFDLFADRIDNLEQKFSRERLSYRLLFLAARFGIKQGAEYMLPGQLNQQVIGSSINLSRESVGREMERLLSRGIVRYDGRKLVICNLQALIEEVKECASPNWWGLSESLAAPIAKTR